MTSEKACGLGLCVVAGAASVAAGGFWGLVAVVVAIIGAALYCRGN